MKACGTAVLVVLLVAGGCSHTSIVVPSGPGVCARLSELASGHEVAITLVDGRKFSGRELLLAPDSTSWLDPATEKLRSVGTFDIAEFRMVNRGKGALQGLGIGLLTGALTGAVVGFAQGDDPEGGWFSEAEDKAILGAMWMTGVGALIGPYVGAGVGHRDIYRFDSPPPREDLR